MPESRSWASSEEGLSAYFVLFSAILSLVLVLSKLLHDRPLLASFLPEAGLILLVGMVAGLIASLFVTTSEVEEEMEKDDEGSTSIAQGLLSFSPSVFFLVLLPPIIFNSGYHLRRELFFRHITPIVLFSVVGTTVSAISIACLLQVFVSLKWTHFDPQFTELLAFGGLISATDPVSTLAVFQAKRVDPHLFYLVFGESVVNDAVGLVLFNSFAKFVERDNGAGKIVFISGEFIVGFLMDSVGSPVLGLLCGCGAAYLFKRIDMRNNRLIELSVYILIMYVPFLTAQLLQLSGIVCILFTGMAARAYVVPNLSESTAETAQILFRLAAHLAETSIFLELGMSVFDLVPGSFQGSFILLSLLACLIARAVNVYPITFLFNKWLREKPDSPTERDEIRYRMSRHRGRRTANHIEMTERFPTTEFSNHQLEEHHHHPGADDQNDQQQQQLSPSQQQQQARSPSSSPPQATTIPDNASDISDGALTEVSCESTTPRFRRDLRIDNSTAAMLWFSGLRGAVAYACVRSFPDTFGHRKDFIVTTMAIVLVTVFFMGGTTELMLNILSIEMDVDEDKYLEEWRRERRSARLIRRFEEFVRRHVVRSEVPYAGAASSDSNTIDSTSHHGDPTEITYSAHMEGGSRHQLERTSSAGYEASGGQVKKKDSLFDYGSKN